MCEIANINDEWENFMSCENDVDIDEVNYSGDFISANISDELCPKASPIYISTKTNISYLNQPIDLKTVFWKIPIIPYSQPTNGVIKKQMKMNSTTPEELEEINENLKNENYIEQTVITSLNNPTGRIKFKDIRKVSIGISKKDLVNYRSKKKSAFYNCFVMIFRIKLGEVFKEFHVKIFNTGKLEIPGIQNDIAFQQILDMVITTMQPYISSELKYQENTTETVLINSNFNCGFYINREVLFELLKYKYNIHCIYDPCSYPGIQCKFYYDSSKGIQTGLQEKGKGIPVSFMIFRTGSVLIVGKCDEGVLNVIYEFLKELLTKEFSAIMLKISEVVVKEKKKKIRRKQIIVS